jgi:hypothetical protein
MEKKKWESVPFPTDRASAEKYAEELARGLKLWVILSSFLCIIALTFWAVRMPGIITAIPMAFAIGCPVILTIGYSYGILQFLTITEAVVIIKEKFIRRV